MVKQVSGVAEDVRVKDEAGTSLGAMAADPREVENDRVRAARDLVGSSER